MQEYNQYNKPVDDNEVLSWDSEISGVYDEYTILQEGEYSFTVKNVERKQYSPGPNSKLPPCPEANVQIEIESDQGTVQVFERLFLVQKMAFRLTQFFVSIGMVGSNDRIIMDWDTVIGRTGRVKIINEEYNGNIYNRVDRFLKPIKDDGFMPKTQPTSAPAADTSWRDQVR